MTKLISIRLLVDDFSKSFAFFNDLMGLPVQWGDENGPYAEFTANKGVSIALFHQSMMCDILKEEAGEEAINDLNCLVFQVDDVAERYKELCGEDVKALIGPRDRPKWGVHTAHIRIPGGQLLEINRPLDKEE